MNPEDQLQAAGTPDEEIQTEEETVQVESTPANEDNEADDDNPETKEKVTFTPEQQEVFDREIGKKVGATREAERKTQEVEAQLQEARSKIPVEQRPIIPDMPDAFDDDFAEKSTAREKAIADVATFDAKAEAKKTQQEDTDRQVAQQRMNAVQQAVNTYTGRAKDLGITQDDLAKAGNDLSAHDIRDDVTLHILQDEKGPAITVYLSKNPLVVDDLRNMNPMQAAIHLENVVKPAAVSSKNSTNAPPPSTNLDGGGSPPSERGPKGATFE